MERANSHPLLIRIAKTLSIAYLVLLAYTALMGVLQPGALSDRAVRLAAGALLILLLWSAYRIALRHQRIGGLLQMIIGLIFTVYFRTYGSAVSFLLISLPLLASGAMFIWHDFSYLE